MSSYSRDAQVRQCAGGSHDSCGSSLGVTPIRPRRSKALTGISGSGRVEGPHASMSHALVMLTSPDITVGLTCSRFKRP